MPCKYKNSTHKRRKSKVKSRRRKSKVKSRRRENSSYKKKSNNLLRGSLSLLSSRGISSLPYPIGNLSLISHRRLEPEKSDIVVYPSLGDTIFYTTDDSAKKFLRRYFLRDNLYLAEPIIHILNNSELTWNDLLMIINNYEYFNIIQYLQPRYINDCTKPINKIGIKILKQNIKSRNFTKNIRSMSCSSTCNDLANIILSQLITSSNHFPELTRLDLSGTDIEELNPLNIFAAEIPKLARLYLNDIVLHHLQIVEFLKLKNLRSKPRNLEYLSMIQTLDGIRMENVRQFIEKILKEFPAIELDIPGYDSASEAESEFDSTEWAEAEAEYSATTGGLGYHL